MSEANLVRARVVAVHRGRVVLRDEEEDWSAPVAGRLLRGDEHPPVTGDWVLAARHGAVQAVLARRGELARGDELLAAHVDLALVATALDHDLSVRRVERLAAMARSGAIAVAVLLTKADLAADPEREAAASGSSRGEPRYCSACRASASRHCSTRGSARSDSARRPSARVTAAGAMRPPIVSCSSSVVARC